MKIAVIYFPGNNCEVETRNSVISAGMECDIIRWNDSSVDLGEYDGYILGGGFSYEDRVRAGVIPAKDPVMDVIRFEATKGKPVLGICNGAQVLIETGIVPGLHGKVEFALAPNINPFMKGYFCTWKHLVKTCSRKTAFADLLKQGEVLHVPIAHAEGRFVTKDENILKELIENDQVVFKYSNKEGEVIPDFPVNPNGSMENIAALCNKEGNVVAMMPHPERCTWEKQLRVFGKKGFNDPAPGQKIFASMKKYIEENKKW